MQIDSIIDFVQNMVVCADSDTRCCVIKRRELAFYYTEIPCFFLDFVFVVSIKRTKVE